MTRGVERARNSRVAFSSILVAATLAAAPLLLCPAARTATRPAHIVRIKQMRFDPQQITIAAGETVEWKNEDMFAHTVTADDGSFDSGLIQPGHSWRGRMRKPGKFVYHCRPHPNMTASIAVQGAADRQKKEDRH